MAEITTRIDTLIDNLKAKITKSPSPQPLDAAMRDELASLLIVLQKIRVLSSRKDSKNIQNLEECESVVTNVEVAIEALCEPTNVKFARKIRRDSEFSVRRLEGTLRGNIGNKLKYFLYESSTTTKVICGLVLALPLHMMSPTIVMIFLNTNYEILHKLVATDTVTPIPTASITPNSKVSSEPIKDALTLLLFCAIAGATGSIVSILTRLDKYDNDDFTDSFLPVLIGMFKPTIGAVFGMFVFFLVGSNVLPISINISDEKSPEKRYFSIISIAFLAGISERFAQDIVSKTEGKFLTQSEAEDMIAQKNISPTAPVVSSEETTK